MPPVSDKWLLRSRIWEQFSKNRDLIASLRVSFSQGRRPHAVIKRACAAFGLNADNATDRNVLLYILAEIIFHEVTGVLDPEFKPPKQTVRKDRWTGERVYSLRKDAVQAARHRPALTINARNLSNIAARLKKPQLYGPFILDYSKMKVSSIARYLRYRRTEAK
jgi:hypothetical protein